MPELSPRVRRAGTEGLVVAVLAALALWYGNFAADHAAYPPDYHYLSPAVAVAAGKGFNMPVAAPGSPLDDFLSRRTMTLPWDVAETMSVEPPDRFHETIPYLIRAVGWWWRVSGEISWLSVGSVGAGLHAMMIVGTYAAIRLFMPVPAAIAGALWMATSTVNLALVPHVRDYSKGAFIVAVLPLTAVLSLSVLPRAYLLGSAAATGLLIGYGLGFKFDVGIMAPLAVAGIVLLRGPLPWRALAEKAQLSAVLVAAMLIAAGPMLARLSEGGSNSFHVVLLGFASDFDGNLGIQPSVYSYLPFYNDGYVAYIVQGHSREWVDFMTPAYDRAGGALFMDFVRAFPADMLARAWGAVNAVMNLCFLGRDPSFLTAPMPAQGIIVTLSSALNRLNGLGPALAIAFLAVASWGNLRRGLLALLVMIVIGGYPSLQFETRHFFHAQVVPVVALLAVTVAVVRMLRASSRPLWSPMPLRPAAAVIALALVLAVIPLATVRAYQSRTLDAAFGTYVDTRVPLQASVVPGMNGASMIRWPHEPAVAHGGPLRDAHYVVEFSDSGTGEALHVGVRYDGPAAMDFSRVITLRPAPGINRVGFNVFTVPGQSGFDGIEVGESARQRFSGVFRVDSDGPAGLPLDVRLPADWPERPLYQQLRIEGDSPATPPLVVCSNGRGCKGLMGHLDRMKGAPLMVSPDSIERVHSTIVRVDPDRVAVEGRVEGESAYLFQFKESTAAAGAVFVAEGRVERGGLAIGLLRQGAWYRQTIVQAPGPFVVVVSVDEAGSYVPLITSAMRPGERVNRSEITKAGFMPADR
jgi:hypothetical protein